MKKFIASLLIAVALFAVSGCDNAADTTASEKQTEPAETTASAQTADPSQATDSGVPVVQVTPKRKLESNEAVICWSPSESGTGIKAQFLMSVFTEGKGFFSGEREYYIADMNYNYSEETKLYNARFYYNSERYSYFVGKIMKDGELSGYGAFNTDGRIIADFKYNYIYPVDKSGYYLMVGYGDKFGLISYGGTTILNPEYDKIMVLTLYDQFNAHTGVFVVKIGKMKYFVESYSGGVAKIDESKGFQYINQTLSGLIGIVDNKPYIIDYYGNILKETTMDEVMKYDFNIDQYNDKHGVPEDFADYQQ